MEMITSEHTSERYYNKSFIFFQLYFAAQCQKVFGVNIFEMNVDKKKYKRD